MIDAKVFLTLIGAIITLAIFVLGIAFKLGHTSARVEEIERWRGSIRNDMHEISDKMQKISEQLAELAILIEERTERRVKERAS